MTWLVSVIIPTYNVELYLEECVLSLLNQTYINLELIFVNDNSTDRSLAILRQYQLIDNRINIINLDTNNGPGYARNIGIEKACGKYIFFVDADDYINDDLINNLIEHLKFKSADILIYNGTSFDEDSGKQTSIKYFNLDESFFSYGKIKSRYQMFLADCHSPCLKVYHCSLFKESCIRFPSHAYGEDVEFWIRCLLHTKKISYIDFVGYHRRYRTGSIMTSGSLKNIKDRIDSFDTLLGICQQNIALYNYIVGIYIPSVARKALASDNKALIDYLSVAMKELEIKYD
ncbi:glycosyltransferase involved in cell wall biosynthesis [Dysgonomonas alginatilytica]|uniref:Glycosyltransferase involved in cell wall biosynthesis n=1 Tax=Dysgonomonas alginatilytica TaxID=1605892 RepID=A0A2V3PSI2_9BACT|nr:glycosyltransferase family 2 protein [Dysgonomonas alginatilytica]PXV65846.1 glycosyltransferase involved in cell wall biosynthesis [Dysgonomonas alginatilytica]